MKNWTFIEHVFFFNMLGRVLLLFHILNTWYTGSLAPVDFSGAVFTCAHFQKIDQQSSLCNFYYISEGIPLLMDFWLLMT